MSVRITPASAADVEVLAAAMRPADVAEVAACGFTARAALLRSVERSVATWSAHRGEELGALFGVAIEDAGTILGGGRIPTLWSLTTPAFGRYPIDFVKASRRVVDVLLEQWPVLVNFVDARYRGALRLLRHLGAEIGPPVSYGLKGEVFHLFCFRRAS